MNNNSNNNKDDDDDDDEGKGVSESVTRTLYPRHASTLGAGEGVGGGRGGRQHEKRGKEGVGQCSVNKEERRNPYSTRP